MKHSTPPTGRIIAIIQARMSSQRLPGKVLEDIAGKPMLVRVIERARRAARLDDAVVATTTDPTDDPLAALCARQGVPCYRGSRRDVLDRVYQAAHAYQADVIIRLTGDCPVIDPAVIDLIVEKFLESGVDFAANRLPPPWKRTYPIGLDTEVCTLQALDRAWQEGDEPHHREHVMPYLYEQAGRFRVLVVDHPQDYGHMRWAVDTPEDLALVRQIYADFGGRDDFTWREILELFRRRPDLAGINVAVHHKDYRESEGPQDSG